MKITRRQKIRSQWLLAVIAVMGALSVMSVMASQLNIYNVTDNTRTVQIKTFSGDPETVGTLAGFDEEQYGIAKDSGDGALVRTLTMEKKFPVRITLEGVARGTRTITKTAGEILAENGIVLRAMDMVVPTADTQITADGAGEIRVIRVTQRTETVRNKIPYATTKRNTSELDFGQTRVVQAGVDGESEQTIQLTLHDGVEAAREVQQETILTQPQTQILECGTGGAVVTRGGEAIRYRKVLSVKATAYSTEGWSHENKFTKIGTRCRVGAIAVDPKVIPLGTRMYVTSADGESWVYGTAVAEDTGSAIKGKRIDLYYNTQDECERFGVRSAKVYLLD